jgi:glycosyltransferase involved in cell wall biosynthesis
MHIITGLASGGAEAMLLKLLSALDSRRFSSTVVSLMDKGTIGSGLEAMGVPVHQLRMSRGMPSPRGLARLVRIIRREQPDLIQAWMYHGNIAAQAAILFAGTRAPVIWNIRGTHTNLRAEPPLTAFVIWLGARLSHLPAFIVNNSIASARSHAERIGYDARKWRIVPNGFDTDKFIPSDHARAALRDELHLAPDTILVSLVGRYHPVKDHAGFLQAARILLATHPDVHFVLVGEGVDASNAALRSQMSGDDRLRTAVHLLGPRGDIQQVTAAADIATSSSTSEGFSNALGEAMSCAVPCVATDVGESAWLVGETGRIVPSRHPARLAAAWSDLIALGSVERRRLGTVARQRIVEHFSLPSVARQYEALYDEALNLRGGG